MASELPTRKPRPAFGLPFNYEERRDSLYQEIKTLTEDNLFRYAADPVAFCREVLAVRLWERQEAILQALVTDKQVAVKSGHGVGKSFTAACAALWFCYCHRPSRVVTTAPTARQVERILWSEIRRLWRQARSPLPGHCHMTRLEAGPDQQALGFTADQPEQAAGLHAEHLLVIVDEASGVPDPLFEVLQGALTSAHCRQLLIGNPTRPAGQFYRCFRTGSWRPFTLSAYDSPNFAHRRARPADGASLSDPSAASDPSEPLNTRTPEPLNSETPYPFPGLVTPEWVEDRRRDWGDSSNAFRVRVLGEFPHQGADTLIELAWLEAAEELMAHGPRLTAHGARLTAHASGNDGPDPEPCTVSRAPCTVSREPVALGLDVARFGDCETVAALREGDTLKAIQAWQGADLMETVGRLIRAIDTYRPQAVVIDAVGMGIGVVDRLRELLAADPAAPGSGSPLSCRPRLVAFSSGERALDPSHFRSRRDETFWGLRERYQQGRLTHAASWPKLVGQLAELRYGFTSSGQTKVETKDELRRRSLPSPDWADAVALAFAPLPRPPHRPMLIGFTRPS